MHIGTKEINKRTENEQPRKEQAELINNFADQAFQRVRGGSSGEIGEDEPLRGLGTHGVASQTLGAKSFSCNPTDSQL
jgi:hypothetical protein